MKTEPLLLMKNVTLFEHTQKNRGYGGKYEGISSINIYLMYIPETRIYFLIRTNMQEQN